MIIIICIYDDSLHSKDTDRNHNPNPNPNPKPKQTQPKDTLPLRVRDCFLT